MRVQEDEREGRQEESHVGARKRWPRLPRRRHVGPGVGPGVCGWSAEARGADCIPRPLGTGRLRAAGLFPQTALAKQACPSQGQTQRDLGTFCLSQG